MTDRTTTDLDGGSAETVRRALASETPLPGTTGFAGAVDGSLVRDALGRRPLFIGREGEGWTWDRTPAPLRNPVALPAGHELPLDRLSDPDLDPRSDAHRVLRLPDPQTLSKRDGLRGLRAAFDGIDLPSDPPVAFSGGVDSALVASASDGPLYVAGFPGSHDLAAARSAATAMGRSSDLGTVEIDREDLLRVVPQIARATGRTNAMDVAIVAPLWLVAERVREDGYERLALGQGADELFGGYDKVARAPTDPRVDAETVRGATREVLDTIPDQVARDVPALRAAGVKPLTPLLHDRIVEVALSLPGDLLVSDRGEPKVGLRLAAREFLPDRVAFRDKKAAQYGSRVARELDRMAREAGFGRGDHDHVSRYVNALLE